MARKPDKQAGGFETEQVGGLLGGFLAEERVSDRSSLWRVGAWGAASVGAVVLAIYANQSSIGSRQEQLAAADLARQAQHLQSVAKEDENERRRLSSAIETLNRDRDRLYSRITVLEQGLESVTGAIARQAASAASAAQVAAAPPAPGEPQPRPQASQSAPVAAPVATAPAPKERPAPQLPAPDQVAKSTSAVSSPAPQETANVPAATPAAPAVSSSKTTVASSDPAPAKSIETTTAAAGTGLREVVAAILPPIDPEAEKPQAALPSLPAQRTEFGIDVGSANSIGGLRALWLGLLKSRSNAPLKELRPIIVIKEGNNGLGMQLRLVAGPFDDAAAAAKICAVLAENKRACETTIFEGQRLAVGPDDPSANARPAGAKPAGQRRSSSTARSAKPVEEPKPAEPSTLSSLFKH